MYLVLILWFQKQIILSIHQRPDCPVYLVFTQTEPITGAISCILIKTSGPAYSPALLSHSFIRQLFDKSSIKILYASMHSVYALPLMMSAHARNGSLGIHFINFMSTVFSTDLYNTHRKYCICRESIKAAFTISSKYPELNQLRQVHTYEVLTFFLIIQKI